MSTETPPIDHRAELAPPLAGAAARGAGLLIRTARTGTESALEAVRPAVASLRLPRAPATRPAPGPALAVLVLLAGVVGLIIAGHAVAWALGLIAGIGGAVCARWERSPQAAAPIAEARDETEAVLQTLSAGGWRRLRDLPGPDGPVDHIAVGRGGVLLIQSLRPEGVVSIRDGEPVQERRPAQGPPRLERIRPRALADTLTAKETIRRLTGRRIWVQAVVVFWSEFPAGCVADGRCVFIHGDRLADWLARRPHQLDPAQVEDVFSDVSVLERAFDGLLPVAV